MAGMPGTSVWLVRRVMFVGWAVWCGVCGVGRGLKWQSMSSSSMWRQRSVQSHTSMLLLRWLVACSYKPQVTTVGGAAPVLLRLPSEPALCAGTTPAAPCTLACLLKACGSFQPLLVAVRW